jgi:hypothetical protein
LDCTDRDPIVSSPFAEPLFVFSAARSRIGTAGRLRRSRRDSERVGRVR